MMAKWVFGLTSLVSCAAGAADLPSFPICTASGIQSFPCAGSHYVAWTDRRNGTSDIYAYDLGTGQEFPVCTNSAIQGGLPSGDVFVWTDNRNGNDDIYGYNRATNTQFPICTNSYGQNDPYISGNIVVWYDARNDAGDIYGYNLSTKQEFPICVKPGKQFDTTITGNIVTWTDSETWDIYGLDLTTMTEFPVCTNGKYKRGGYTNGSVFVWHESVSGGFQIRAFDRSTDAYFSISTSDNYQIWPTISGDFVAWTDNRGIYGYNLITKEEFPICTQPDVSMGFIGGNVVVWRTGNGDIYGAYVPEPATLSLLALGGLALIRRKPIR